MYPPLRRVSRFRTLEAVYVDDASEYDLRMAVLRGTARVLAALTGLLLVYGITYALEGITTRIPTAAARELAIGVLWTVPWSLLFCSGLQDVTIVTGKQ
jgi:hypothetical protein